MHLPRVYPISGVECWTHCDHDHTMIDFDAAAVRLAPSDLTNDEDERVHLFDWMHWHAVRGGAIWLTCPPDHCDRARVVRAVPGRGLFVDSPDGWMSLSPPPPSLPRSSDPTMFTPLATDEPSRDSLTARTISRDANGAIWILERGHDRHRIRILSERDLQPIGEFRPSGSSHVGYESVAFDPTDLANTSWGAVAIDQHTGFLWRSRHGGPWELVAIDPLRKEDERPWRERVGLIDYAPISVAGHPESDTAVVLMRRARTDREEDPVDTVAVVIGRSDAEVMRVPGLEDPLHVLMRSDGRVIIGEIEPDTRPRSRQLSRFHEFRVVDGALAFERRYGVRGFDGVAILLDPAGQPWATVEDGVRRMFDLTRDVAEYGRVETYALDSQVAGCQWHRVFVDACVPAGTRIELSARTSDTLLDPDWAAFDDRPRLPLNVPTRPEPSQWDDLRLGSRSAADEEGWQPLGALDRRAHRIDVPFAPDRIELPSETVRAEGGRGCGDDGARGRETFEGLIKNGPGRYLWLRLELHGTRKRSPVIDAVRISYARPSLLDHLPSFWRADPASALMDQFLALFEGGYTETDRRIAEMSLLFDPRSCPPDALDWLAKFMALQLDPRLREGVRRQLLMEIATLYRQRGTVPGLTRFCSIVTEAPVQIVDGFRMRRSTGAVLGASDVAGPREDHSVLGPGLQLGGGESKERPGDVEPWEQELREKRALLEARRAALGDPLCPPELSDALPEDEPMMRFYRAHAHRFSVLVFREREDLVSDVLERAIEIHKPAHTIHEVCWLDAGFRLGTNTYTGVGTRVGCTDCWEPGIIGDATLGTRNTVWTHQPDPSGSLRLGSDRLGVSTNTADGASCAPRIGPHAEDGRFHEGSSS